MNSVQMTVKMQLSPVRLAWVRLRVSLGLVRGTAANLF